MLLQKQKQRLTSSRKLFLSQLILPIVSFRRVWKLVQLELKIRYKRSKIGPMWYLLSFILKIIVLSGVYTVVLNKKPEEYIPYLLLGVSMWTYISSSMQYGSNSLISHCKYVFFDPDRVFLFVFKGVVRELLLSCLLLSWSVLFIAVSTELSFYGLIQATLGLLLCTVFIYLASSILALACLKYTDISHLFSSLMNIFFIATPVIWDFSDVPQVQEVMIYNPFFYLVEVVRYPLLGRILPDFFYFFYVISVPILILCLWLTYKKIYRNLAKYA